VSWVEACVAEHPQGQQVVEGPLPVVEGQGVKATGQPIQHHSLDATDCTHTHTDKNTALVILQLTAVTTQISDVEFG
jgi:hypothetical protein